jgi:hypothetical protein
MDGTFGAGTEGKWIGVGAGIARCGADGWMEGVGGGLMDAEILIAGQGWRRVNSPWELSGFLGTWISWVSLRRPSFPQLCRHDFGGRVMFTFNRGFISFDPRPQSSGIAWKLSDDVGLGAIVIASSVQKSSQRRRRNLLHVFQQVAVGGSRLDERGESKDMNKQPLAAADGIGGERFDFANGQLLQKFVLTEEPHRSLSEGASRPVACDGKESRKLDSRNPETAGRTEKVVRQGSPELLYHRRPADYTLLS